MFWLFEDARLKAIENIVGILLERKEELLLEDSGVIKHLTHLEDLVLDGKVQFVNVIKNLLRIARQHEGADDTLVVEKIDGAPALFFLNDPRNGEFGVSTKSIGSKTQKIAHSSKEIRNLFDKEGLQIKLEAALIYLKGLNLNNYAFQGDVLFTREDVRKQRIKGKDYLTFTPNVLMYAVAIDSNSELYKKVASSEFGLVVHTIYKIEKDDESLKLTQVRNPQVIYNLVKQAEDVQGLFMTHPFHPQIKLEVAEEDIKKIEDLLAELEKTSYKSPSPFTKQLFARFVNAMIRENWPVSWEGFNSWIQQDMNTEMVKKKTKKGQDAVEEKYYKVQEEIESPSFRNFLKAYLTALEIKKIFLRVFGKVQSKLGATFFGQELTGPEGFVLSADDGIVKLVDRTVFSRQNFLFGSFNLKK
jgi:hypothetical protein